ncbi:hypothetical protein [Virgibacillus sp. DJP39]|uniref:hypothetical protein n=1 Tax=Virgibacillus sp. DJP39 TaxID=3409790 RepID=UPI003BB5EA55
MNDRKTIIVWMDGKKTKLTKKKNVQHSHINSEIAAAKETNEDDQIPTYVRENSFETEEFFKTSTSKRKGSKTYKHIFTAIISAIVLGTALGIFMLNMFTNIDINSGPVAGKMNSSTDSTNNDAGNTGNGTVVSKSSTYSLEGFKAFVLQAGLFNENSSVTAVQDQFKQPGIPTMVWKKGEKFYLFATVTNTKDQANAIKSSYKNLNLETYAKEWSVKKAELKITEAEYKWLQDFHTLWNKTLENVSNNKKFSSTDWNSWVKAYPAQGEKTREFYEAIKKLDPKIGEISQNTAPVTLLKLLRNYENLIVN